MHYLIFDGAWSTECRRLNDVRNGRTTNSVTFMQQMTSTLLES